MLGRFGGWLLLVPALQACSTESTFDRHDATGFYVTTEHARNDGACDGRGQAQSVGNCLLVDCSEDCRAPLAIEVTGVGPCEDGKAVDLQIARLVPEGERWLGTDFDAMLCVEHCLGGTTAGCSHMCPLGSESCILTARRSKVEWVEPEVISLEVRHLRLDVAVPAEACTDALARSSEREMHCTGVESLTAERVPIPD